MGTVQGGRQTSLTYRSTSARLQLGDRSTGSNNPAPALYRPTIPCLPGFPRASLNIEPCLGRFASRFRDSLDIKLILFNIAYQLLHTNTLGGPEAWPILHRTTVHGAWRAKSVKRSARQTFARARLRWFESAAIRLMPRSAGLRSARLRRHSSSASGKALPPGPKLACCFCCSAMDAASIAGSFPISKCNHAIIRGRFQ